MDKKSQLYFITGSAGFIGFHVAKTLLERGDRVVGIDNFNDYYEISLKEDRNKILEKYENFTLVRGDISDVDLVRSIFEKYTFDAVCHLAAQAGVRLSIKEPYRYIQANIVGFSTIINEAKNVGIKNFVYASSSSVYGDQNKTPLVEEFNTDSPISLYAATKKSNEMIAHTYHHLYGMQCTGLRFFTVYGPWGRPDMAIFSFTKAILSGEPIQVFNNGDMRRDFTYIDDIVAGVISSLSNPQKNEIINLGNHEPVILSEMIEILEKEIGMMAKKEFLPIQPGDVVETYAGVGKAKGMLGWTPNTDIQKGIKNFIEWYKEYYKK